MVDADSRRGRITGTATMGTLHPAGIAAVLGAFLEARHPVRLRLRSGITHEDLVLAVEWPLRAANDHALAVVTLDQPGGGQVRLDVNLLDGLTIERADGVDH